MKTLVLNTLGKEVSEQIKAQIKDKEVEIVDTSGMKIAHCMGCNQCWLKTPGICAIRDDYEEIIKKLVETENLWIVSDTRFGFLDYKGKRVMDRIMPMLNMTVGFRDGWMRHEMRYHPLNIGPYTFEPHRPTGGRRKPGGYHWLGGVNEQLTINKMNKMNSCAHFSVGAAIINNSLFEKQL